MLLEQRREIGLDGRTPEEGETIAFVKSSRETGYHPVSLSQPLFRLDGDFDFQRHAPSYSLCLGYIGEHVDCEQRVVSSQPSSYCNC